MDQFLPPMCDSWMYSPALCIQSRILRKKWAKFIKSLIEYKLKSLQLSTNEAFKNLWVPEPNECATEWKRPYLITGQNFNSDVKVEIYMSMLESTTAPNYLGANSSRVERWNANIINVFPHISDLFLFFVLNIYLIRLFQSNRLKAKKGRWGSKTPETHRTAPENLW